MLEAMNEFEQILAHLSGCQRAFVLPRCPAEWLPTTSPRLADHTKMSTPHYNQILLFHTLPQPPPYPLLSPPDALSASLQSRMRCSFNRAFCAPNKSRVPARRSRRDLFRGSDIHVRHLRHTKNLSPPL